MNDPNGVRLPKNNLTVPEDLYLKDCERDYNFYFEKYTPEFANFEEMKNAAVTLIEENLETYSESTCEEYPMKHAFYKWCNYNLDNVDLLMDLRLLVVMGEWGDHREADTVEWFILHKYRPY